MAAGQISNTNSSYSLASLGWMLWVGVIGTIPSVRGALKHCHARTGRHIELNDTNLHIAPPSSPRQHYAFTGLTGRSRMCCSLTEWCHLYIKTQCITPGFPPMADRAQRFFTPLPDSSIPPSVGTEFQSDPMFLIQIFLGGLVSFISPNTDHGPEPVSYADFPRREAPKTLSSCSHFFFCF